jgi:hypothetical protein
MTSRASAEQRLHWRACARYLVLFALLGGCARQGAMVELKLEGAIGETFKAETELGLGLDSSERLSALVKGDDLSLIFNSSAMPHFGPLIVDELKLHDELIDANGLVLSVTKLTMPTDWQRGIELDGKISGSLNSSAGESAASGTFWVVGDCDPAYASLCAVGVGPDGGPITRELRQPQTPVGCELALQNGFSDGDPGAVEVTYDPEANTLALQGGPTLSCLKSPPEIDARNILCSGTGEVKHEGCTYAATVWGHTGFLGISGIAEDAGCERKDCTISFWP